MLMFVKQNIKPIRCVVKKTSIVQRDQIIWFRAPEYKCLHIGSEEADLERFWYLQTLFETL